MRSPRPGRRRSPRARRLPGSGASPGTSGGADRPRPRRPRSSRGPSSRGRSQPSLPRPSPAPAVPHVRLNFHSRGVPRRTRRGQPDPLPRPSAAGGRLHCHTAVAAREHPGHPRAQPRLRPRPPPQLYEQPRSASRRPRSEPGAGGQRSPRPQRRGPDGLPPPFAAQAKRGGSRRCQEAGSPRGGSRGAPRTCGAGWGG